jgi:hypothetical protein
MGKEILMAGGVPRYRDPAGFSPPRIGTPVLSTFLALPNGIFKGQSRNLMIQPNNE